MDLEYYVSQFSSNEPSEDRFSSRYVKELGSFYCVIDGHGGCFTCNIVQDNILDLLINEIKDIDIDNTSHNHTPHNNNTPHNIIKKKEKYNPKVIIQLFNNVFKKCDELILQLAVNQLTNYEGKCPGRTGCCVVVSAIIEERLYVGHVGDCRAVICRKLTNLTSTSNFNINMSTSPIPSRSQSNDIINNINLSPQKKSTKTRSSDSIESTNISTIPKKRSKSDDLTSETPLLSLHITPPPQPPPIISSPPLLPRRGLIVRDFHLESVVNLQPKVHKSFPEAPPLVSLISEDQRLNQQQHEEQLNQQQISTETDINSNQLGNTEEKQIKKKKKKTKVFIETDFDYEEFSGEFQELNISIHCLTKDHCCDDKDERTALKMLCPTDPRPMRPSLNDKKLFGKDAIKRVAGTLAVTRALGDGYLKISCLSEEPYKSHVPYITSQPFVSSRKLIPGIDSLLLLASDGLWNYITIEEVANILSEYLQYRLHKDNSNRLNLNNTVSSISSLFYSQSVTEILLNKCLQNAAILAGTSYDSLINMPSGPYKRNVIDDVTIALIILPENIS